MEDCLVSSLLVLSLTDEDRFVAQETPAVDRHASRVLTLQVLLYPRRFVRLGDAPLAPADVDGPVAFAGQEA